MFFDNNVSTKSGRKGFSSNASGNISFRRVSIPKDSKNERKTHTFGG